MNPRNSSLNRFYICVAFVLSVVSTGCVHTGNGYGGPPSAGTEIELVELGALPLEAHFIEIGSIGTAYRLAAERAAPARFPIPKGAADGLLPATVRLFRFDEEGERWLEIADSHYDKKNRELVGTDLRPGLYTAFGWSANPVENVLQRLLLDAALGYGPLAEIPELRPRPESNQSMAVAELRRAVIAPWLVAQFTYSVTSCAFTEDPADPEGDPCPSECTIAAQHQRVVRRNCRLEEFPDVDCRQAGCCDCVTGTWTERLVIPRDLLEIPPLPCRGVPPGSLCPLCPRGLSCPSGPFTGLQQIAPTLEVPDYTILDRFGLGVITEDTVLRDELHALVEEITGNRYPVPPPWP